ncbi:MAG: cell division protein FtsX [Hyphomicrobiaceae bacterium]
MSGSYDRRHDGYPELRTEPRDDGRATSEFETSYNDIRTGPPTGHAHLSPNQSQTGGAGPGGVYAPARSKQKKGKIQHAPIVPAKSVTGKSLTLVITIMCFLACLTVGAVYLINQSADAWLRDIASEVTIQIEPVKNTDIEKRLKDVADFMERQPGVSAATPLSLAASTKLLEPWLGDTEALSSLPVPRLIAIEINRTAPPNFDNLRTALSGKFKNVLLDDHRQWKRQIQTVTRSFALGGIAILLLVAAATTAIIVSATRSAMLANREIVEVLHFVGATDRFISHEFEKHFLNVGIRAGLVGALCAMVVFVVMPFVMQLLGGGAVTLAELNRFVGTGSLDLLGYIALGFVVATIAALCMLTSRFGVYRILNSQS